MAFANFELFQNKQSRPQGATLTIGVRGVLMLSPAAYEQLGSPHAVELLYNRDEQVIGLRPADRGAPNSYLVRRQNHSKSVIVSARAFLRHYGLAVSDHAERRPATVEDGVLCVRLSDPATLVTSNRAKA